MCMCICENGYIPKHVYMYKDTKTENKQTEVVTAQIKKLKCLFIPSDSYKTVFNAISTQQY